MQTINYCLKVLHLRLKIILLQVFSFFTILVSDRCDTRAGVATGIFSATEGSLTSTALGFTHPSINSTYSSTTPSPTSGSDENRLDEVSSTTVLSPKCHKEVKVAFNSRTSF